MQRRFEVIESRQSQQLPPRRRVLLLGEHRALLRASAEVLSNIDVDVVYCHPSDLNGRSREQFNLAVLCHTLTRQQAAAIAAEARERWPQLRILQISRFGFGLLPIPSHADAVASCGNILDLYTTAMELLGDPPEQATTPGQRMGSADHAALPAAHGPVLQRRCTGSD